MSPGRVALPPGMFSQAGKTATTLHRGLELANRRHRTEHAARAAHVELHLVHLRRRLHRDAAGVERDALADDRDRRGLRVGAAIADHDDLRGLLGALRDGEHRAHPETAHVGLAEHFDFELVEALRERARGFRDVRRRADVRRPVAEVPGEIGAVGDRGADLDAPPRRALVRVYRQAYSETRELRWRLPAALELVESVRLSARGFDALTSSLLDADRVTAVREIRQGFARSAAAQRCECGGERYA